MDRLLPRIRCQKEDIRLRLGETLGHNGRMYHRHPSWFTEQTRLQTLLSAAVRDGADFRSVGGTVTSEGWYGMEMYRVTLEVFIRRRQTRETVTRYRFTEWWSKGQRHLRYLSGGDGYDEDQNSHPLKRSLVFWYRGATPDEPPVHTKCSMERAMGFEPTTTSLGS